MKGATSGPRSKQNISTGTIGMTPERELGTLSPALVVSARRITANRETRLGDTMDYKYKFSIHMMTYPREPRQRHTRASVWIRIETSDGHYRDVSVASNISDERAHWMVREFADHPHVEMVIHGHTD